MFITILIIFFVIYLCALFVEVRNNKKKNHVWLSLEDYKDMKDSIIFLDFLESRTKGLQEYEEAVSAFQQEDQVMKHDFTKSKRKASKAKRTAKRMRLYVIKLKGYLTHYKNIEGSKSWGMATAFFKRKDAVNHINEYLDRGCYEVLALEATR